MIPPCSAASSHSGMNTRALILYTIHLDEGPHACAPAALLQGQARGYFHGKVLSLIEIIFAFPFQLMTVNAGGGTAHRFSPVPWSSRSQWNSCYCQECRTYPCIFAHSAPEPFCDAAADSCWSFKRGSPFCAWEVYGSSWGQFSL